MSYKNDREAVQTPTGHKLGKWKEYIETPINHTYGYFWLRSDGLRIGYRSAGKYYREGTVPKIPCPVRYINANTLPDKFAISGQQNYDVNGVGIPVFTGENEIEKKKMVELPSHIRVMRDGKEIEIITSIDGKPIEDFDVKKVLAYIDKKYPLPLRK